MKLQQQQLCVSCSNSAETRPLPLLAKSFTSKPLSSNKSPYSNQSSNFSFPSLRSRGAPCVVLLLYHILLLSSLFLQPECATAKQSSSSSYLSSQQGGGRRSSSNSSSSSSRNVARISSYQDDEGEEERDFNEFHHRSLSPRTTSKSPGGGKKSRAKQATASVSTSSSSSFSSTSSRRSSSNPSSTGGAQHRSSTSSSARRTARPPSAHATAAAAMMEEDNHLDEEELDEELDHDDYREEQEEDDDDGEEEDYDDDHDDDEEYDAGSRRRTRPPPSPVRRSQSQQQQQQQQQHPGRHGRRPPVRRVDRRHGPQTLTRRVSAGAAYYPPPHSSARTAGRRSSGRGSIVPYHQGSHHHRKASSALTSVIAGIRSAVPDTDAVKNAALSSIKAARETTSSISSNLYREVKGLTSSELEQVMLKATRPDDTAVKSKHVERLVGVTYQISARYDIYDAVLRKLWSKMAENDWRTTIKALYILHRFSADGAPDHAAALKARLRELRRTRDPKRKDKYFNSKQLLNGDVTLINGPYRAFMSRYAHYVLLRAQCFSGMFDEIASLPKPDPSPSPSSSKKKLSVTQNPAKPITATSLRAEHLEAAALLLKAGTACQLRDGEECENTAIAAERVASDLIGLTTATAIALNRALKAHLPSSSTHEEEANDDDDVKVDADPVLLQKWCHFYGDELQPQTRAMVKRTSSKLDAYGLFLPSRMGTSVSRDLLEMGLNLEAVSQSRQPTSEVDAIRIADDAATSVASKNDKPKSTTLPASKKEASHNNISKRTLTSTKAITESSKTITAEPVNVAAANEGNGIKIEAEIDDEYEYEEEDYYDTDDGTDDSGE